MNQPYAWLALALYVVPIVVTLGLRSLRRRPAWELALDVPFAVAVDFLGILVVARFVHLEGAILVSRVAWLSGGLALLLWRRRGGARFHAPEGIDARSLLGVAAAAALSALVSMEMSHVYRVWDRYWHIPLASSLRGQSVPFQNVYQPGVTLHYHWMGDVFAQTLQTLSFDHVSSDVGLILSHDVCFALIGAVVALLMISFGHRAFWPAVLGGVATVLQGPVPLRGGSGLNLDGYAYHNFLTNSLRPHLALAGLLMTGFVGAVAVRLRFRDAAPRGTFPVLLAVTTLLGVTDEPSDAMLLVALGAAWLVHPGVVSDRRRWGILGLLALGGAVVLINAVFGGSLAPGSPVQSLEWVKPRIPGAHTEIPIFSMWSKEGNLVLLFDFLPFAAVATGLTLARVGPTWRAWSARVAFAWTMVLLAFIGLTRIEVNHLAAVEVQRYFVAPFFATYVLALPELHRMRRGSAASIAVVGGVAIAAVSTIFWVREQLPKELDYARLEKKWMGMMENTVTSDCVSTTGSRFGETPRAMYVEASVWYLWVGCHPVFAPGWSDRQWTTKTRPAGEGRSMDELRAIDQDLVSKDAALPAACLSDVSRSDAVCARARAHSTCTPRGTLFELCELSARDRADLLAGR